MDYFNWIVANPWASFLIAMCATWFTTEVIEVIGKAIGNARRK
jgi:hypothetical protein